MQISEEINLAKSGIVLTSESLESFIVHSQREDHKVEQNLIA